MRPVPQIVNPDSSSPASRALPPRRARTAPERTPGRSSATWKIIHRVQIRKPSGNSARSFAGAHRSPAESPWRTEPGSRRPPSILQQNRLDRRIPANPSTSPIGSPERLHHFGNRSGRSGNTRLPATAPVRSGTRHPSPADFGVGDGIDPANLNTGLAVMIPDAFHRSSEPPFQQHGQLQTAQSVPDGPSATRRTQISARIRRAAGSSKMRQRYRRPASERLFQNFQREAPVQLHSRRPSSVRIDRAVRPCLPITLPRSLGATRNSRTVTCSPSTSLTVTSSGISTRALAISSTNSFIPLPPSCWIDSSLAMPNSGLQA